MEKEAENNDSVMENEKPVENSENQMEVDNKTSFPELDPEGPSVLLFTDNNSSLKLLTQYGSESSSGESDEESEVEEVAEAVESDGSDIDILKQISQNIISPFGQETENYSSVGEYREQKPFVVLHDSNSESSSSDSDSDDELKRIPDSEILEHIAVKLEEGSDNENPDDEENESDKGSKKKRDPLKVKGELSLDELPPIEDLRITVPEDECIKIGAISSIVDQLVLVQALPNIAPLDLESVLFLESGKKPLGHIFDVLGQVSQPIYCVRFNSHDDVINKKIEVGQDVFCAPRTEYASFVILNNIMNMRGSDASWKNDIEPPESQLDFSDDEHERQVKRNKKNKNRNRVINPANPVNQQRFSSNAPNMNHQPRQQWPGNNPNPRFQQNNYSWHGNFSQPSQFPSSSGFNNYRYPNPNGQQSYWRHQNNNNNNNNY